MRTDTLFVLAFFYKKRPSCLSRNRTGTMLWASLVGAYPMA